MQKGGRYVIDQLDDDTHSVIDRATDRIFMLMVCPVLSTSANYQVIVAEVGSSPASDHYVEFLQETYSLQLFSNRRSLDSLVAYFLRLLIDGENFDNPTDLAANYGGLLHGLPVNVPPPLFPLH